MLDQLTHTTKEHEAHTDGGRTEALFAQMCQLAEDDPHRERIRAEIVHLHTPYARHAARRYADRGEPLEDLEQAAFVGLVKAINAFDPTLGHRFISYASVIMVGEVKRHFRDQTWRVHIPRRLQEQGIVLRHAAMDFIQQHGRGPTTAEIAELMGLTAAETMEIIVASEAYRTESIDVPYSPEQDTEPLADRLGSEDPALDLLVNTQSLSPLIAGLPERDRFILSLRFSGDQTQVQIGEQLGISQMQVSRLLRRILQYLRAGLLADQ